MTAANSDDHARTHEPSLRELTAELDGLREVLQEKIRASRELMDERHQRYTERDHDRQREVEKALVAAEAQTAAAFQASKEAIAEAKKAQDAYNLTHNDLLRKMEAQAASTVTRAEANAKFDGLTTSVQEIKSALAGTGAAIIGGKAVKDETRVNIAIVLSFMSLLAAIVFFLLKG